MSDDDLSRGQPRPRASGLALPPGSPGAFTRLRARWLPLWAAIGFLLIMTASSAVEGVTGTAVPDDLLTLLMYLPLVAWLWFAVVVRAGVDLGAMLRWPRLGAFWLVVAGLLVVQFLFSIGAVILTNLVAPWLGDAAADIGQGNLALAVIGIVILPPLVEEIAFRGVLLERWAVKWRVGVAVVVSAVAFAVLHADPVGAGMFGVVTALLYLRTGSLWPGILIHLANNLAALALTRVAAQVSEPTVPEPSVGESLMSAGVLMALSLPFLVWFIRSSWPRRGAPTPYQRHEGALDAGHSRGPTTLAASGVAGGTGGGGAAPYVVAPVSWSGAPGPVRLAVTDRRLEVGWPGEAVPFAVLPIERVAAAYPAATTRGVEVVVLLADGTWTTVDAADGDPSANEALARVIAQRVAWASAAQSR